MINYKLFKENGIPLKSIKRIKSSFLINDGKNNYIIKENKESIENKLKYLASRNFNNIPKYFLLDKYIVSDYISDSNISIEERLTEIINLIALLHTKTTRYNKIDIDDYKIIYEDLNQKIEHLNNYYTSLNDYIDNEIYMSPSHYLLVLNISKIYSALTFCKNELNDWYEIIKNNKKQRKVFIHNNLELDHLIYNKAPYLISWDKSKVDIPIYDLISLYKKYYNIISFDVLLNNYQKKYPLSTEEIKLFFIIISIPKKVDFDRNEFKNIKKVKALLEQLSKGDELIRQYYQKIKKPV